jgi:hypothetical protein
LLPALLLLGEKVSIEGPEELTLQLAHKSDKETITYPHTSQKPATSGK